MNRRNVGPFQIAVLGIIARQSENSYGSGITDEIARVSGQKVDAAQTYVALNRLEHAGLISSRKKTGEKRVRGRPRKYYSLTADGRRALKASSNLLRNIIQ